MLYVEPQAGPAPVDVIENAARMSWNNADSLREHEKCGCYFCIRVFDSADVTEFLDDGSALCPNCEMDALLPGVTNLEVLTAASERWFNGLNKEEGACNVAK